MTVKAFDRLGLDRKGIVALTMPGFGTTARTRSNAEELAEQLGVTLRVVSIDKAVRQHFRDIGHNPSSHDVTYENSQARERTQILMDVANQVGGWSSARVICQNLPLVGVPITVIICRCTQ